MMTEKRFERWNDHSCKVKDNQEDTFLNWEDVVKRLNEQQDTINKQENEIMKLKSLLNFSEKMMDTDLIINLRYSYGKWKADVSVIDDEC